MSRLVTIAWSSIADSELGSRMGVFPTGATSGGSFPSRTELSKPLSPASLVNAWDESAGASVDVSLSMLDWVMAEAGDVSESTTLECLSAAGEALLFNKEMCSSTGLRAILRELSGTEDAGASMTWRGVALALLEIAVISGVIGWFSLSPGGLILPGVILGLPELLGLYQMRQ